MASKKKGAAKRRGAKGTSKFSDRICNLVPSRDTVNDWTYQDALASGAFGAPAALPQKVGLRKAWWSINDQGNTGSCVGWATADGIMRYHMVQANRLPQNQLLSPRFVWMASKETDEFSQRPGTFIEAAGTSLKAALSIVKNYGNVLETDLVFDTDLPFKIDTLMYVGSETEFYANASLRKAANYFNLAKNLTQWKSWLANNGPILAGLSVDATWDNAKVTQGNLDMFQPGTVRGGHAVCIVGYTADRFIIRNSWGTTWGDKGFGYASVAYINDGFFGESYGITL